MGTLDAAAAHMQQYSCDALCGLTPLYHSQHYTFSAVCTTVALQWDHTRQASLHSLHASASLGP